MNASGFQVFTVKRYDAESYNDYMERSFFILNNVRSGKYTFDDLVEELLKDYAVEKMLCEHDTKELLEQLREKNIIRIVT